jgi:hypothetical protein
MRIPSPLFFVFPVFVVFVVACSSSSTPSPDGGGSKADAKVGDTGAKHDAPAHADTGTTSGDTGAHDTGVSMDAEARDTGTHEDTGIHEDAGADSGTPTTDAKPHDTGTDTSFAIDSGPSMNCQVIQDCQTPPACVVVACVGAPGTCQYSYAQSGTACGTGSTCDSQGHCQ